VGNPFDFGIGLMLCLIHYNLERKGKNEGQRKVTGSAEPTPRG
ncbi:MAG: hypothetical protein XU11_C0002G0001, partial [Candidatus Dadabacteria bacterium CSP1-2]